eukprot:IDg1586t1
MITRARRPAGTQPGDFNGRMNQARDRCAALQHNEEAALLYTAAWTTTFVEPKFSSALYSYRLGSAIYERLQWFFWKGIDPENSPMVLQENYINNTSTLIVTDLSECKAVCAARSACRKVLGGSTRKLDSNLFRRSSRISKVLSIKESGVNRISLSSRACKLA